MFQRSSSSLSVIKLITAQVYALCFSLIDEEQSMQFPKGCLRGIVPLIGHCIAAWYAVFRYFVKLTELETSWGVAIQ